MNQQELVRWIENTQQPQGYTPWGCWKPVEEREWDRVQRRREEGKCLGGNYREWEPMVNIFFSITLNSFKRRKQHESK